MIRPGNTRAESKKEAIMQCYRCGGQIKDTLTVCPLCGAELRPRPPQGEYKNIWEAPEEVPAYIDPPKESSEKGMGAETKKSASGRPIRRRRAFVSDPDELHDLSGNQEIDMVVPPTPVVGARPRYTVDWPRFLLSLAVGLLALAIVGFLVWRGGTALYRHIRETRIQEAQEEEARVPLVERILMDGSYWHRITFYGDDGARILIDSPRATLSVHNGIAEYMLEDAALIPEAPEADTIDVSISATLIHADGSEEPIPSVSYSVDVPQAFLKLVDPAEQSLTITQTRLLITLKVDVGSRVIVGGSNVTDLVNSDGVVSASVPIDDVGLNTVTISVESSKHRKATCVLEVMREPMDVEIQVDDSVLSSTEDGAVLISGRVEPGASVTTDASLQGELSCDGNGVFSFTAKLTKYGWNLINITAEKDGRTATLGYQVRHVPNLESYTRKAWAMDYSYLSLSTDALMGQVFLCEGKITEFLDDDVSTLMRFNCGDETHPQFIILEYSGDATLRIGGSYRVYADVVGTYDNLPRLAARFIYAN